MNSLPAIVPLVEGQSEQRSVGDLLRRTLAADAVAGVLVAQPFRVKRNKVVRPGELEKSIRQASRSRPGAAAILLLLDADDDCPVRLAGELLDRAREITDFPVSVVVACRELEAWFLAAKTSLRGIRGIAADAAAPDHPESPRDAKGLLSRNMVGDRRYLPVDDQPALAACMDLAVATERSASFAKFVREVRRLAAAVA